LRSKLDDKFEVKIRIIETNLKDRRTDRQKVRKTEIQRQRDRETERQRDRETERQRDRKAEMLSTILEPILKVKWP
jgi:hypothetical protein